MQHVKILPLAACGDVCSPSAAAAAVMQVASPHIKAQWAWASACNLIKMTSVRPEAFPVSCMPCLYVAVDREIKLACKLSGEVGGV